MADKITFSFGENWQHYLTTVSDADIKKSMLELEDILGIENIENKSVIDIGCGSGIHSLSFLKLKAASVFSFDFDERSVAATETLNNQAGNPPNWKIERASALDKKYMESIGLFDIVYSWGVLHHTGKMWKAIEYCTKLVKPGGFFLLGIYGDVNHYQRDLALKKAYNNASAIGKKWMVYSRILKKMLLRIIKFQNPFTWNEKRGRGMNYYNDLIDWLGGLPYEVASEDEIVRFFTARNFVLHRINVRRAVFTYLFKKSLQS